MDWLLTPSLANSQWLTPDVRSAFKKRRAGIAPEPSQESTMQAMVDSTNRLQGEAAAHDPAVLARLQSEYDTVWPARYEEMLRPLARNGSYSHLPPSAVASHNGCVIPYLATFGDGGRLILIDPVNCLFLTGMCSAALQWAYNRLSAEESKELVDFMISTAASYSPNRHLVDERLGSATWTAWYWRIIHQDLELLPLAEGLATNALAFAFFHENAHSILDHASEGVVLKFFMDGVARSMPVLSWQLRQELEADALAGRYFQELVAMRPQFKHFPTGDQVDHAPYVVFRMLELVWQIREKIENRRSPQDTHPRPLERIQRLRDRFGNLSTEGGDLFAAFDYAIRNVEQTLKQAASFNRIPFPK